MNHLTQQTFLIILNPGAYGLQSDRRRRQLETWLREYGMEADIRESADPEDLSKLAEEGARHYSLIVAAGGDGTISRVAAGLVNTDAVLGILPFGSGNDLALGMKIPIKPYKALHSLKYGNVRDVDVGWYNEDQIFINSIGMAFDGQASYNASQTVMFKGPFKYIFGVLKSIFTYKPSRVTVDLEDETITEDLLLVTIANTEVEGGGIYIAPDADPCDGRMELVMVRDVAVLLRLPLLLRVLLGDPRKIKQITYRKSAYFRVRHSNHGPAHADGEIFTNALEELEVNVSKGALKVVAGF